MLGLTMMAWRSPVDCAPPSMGVSGPNGYGPGSLSRRTGTSRSPAAGRATPPCRGCRRGCSGRPKARSPGAGWWWRCPCWPSTPRCGDRRAVGEMLVFHTLSAGNIGQLGAPGSGCARPRRAPAQRRAPVRPDASTASKEVARSALVRHPRVLSQVPTVVLGLTAGSHLTLPGTPIVWQRDAWPEKA